MTPFNSLRRLHERTTSDIRRFDPRFEQETADFICRAKGFQKAKYYEHGNGYPVDSHMGVLSNLNCPEKASALSDCTLTEGPCCGSGDYGEVKTSTLTKKTTVDVNQQLNDIELLSFGMFQA